MNRDRNSFKWILGCLLSVLAIPALAQQSDYTYDLPGNLTAVIGTNVALPSITTQPQPALLHSNNAVSFSIVAGGAGVSYQWLSNGVPIIGTTQDTLFLANPVSTNGSFSVIVSNTSGSVTSTPAAIWADSNGNGMPDWWEIKYFGNLNQTALGDYDGDGVDNLDEYLEGTDPTNPNSYDPRLTIQTTRGGTVTAAPSQPYYTMGQQVILTALRNSDQMFLGWSGTASGTNVSTSIQMNASQTVSANFGIPLPIALNNTNVAWSTGGNGLWTGQTQVYEDGRSAGQSGFVPSLYDANSDLEPGSSWLQAVTTNLSLPAQVSFWWEVSSQPSNTLSFAVDGNTISAIAGIGGSWQLMYTNITSGSHTLTWTYAKNTDDAITGLPVADAGWVDEVTLVPLTVLNKPVAVFDDIFFTSTLNQSAQAPTSTSTTWQIVSQKNATGSTILANDLRLAMVATTAGFTEAQALFTTNPVTLASPGDYIDLQITFTNTQNLLFNLNSALYAGLYTSDSSPPLYGLNNGGLNTNNGSAFATNGVQLWQGYVGRIGYSNGYSAMAVRPPQNGPGTTSANQDLVGNNSTSGNSYNNPAGDPLVVSKSTNGSAITLLTGQQYTLDFNVTLAATGVLILAEGLYNGNITNGPAIYSQSATASGADFLTPAYDGLAFGERYNNSVAAASTMDISQINITALIQKFGAPPQITRQPMNQILEVGDTAQISVVASGALPLVFNWQQNGTNLTDSGSISGSESATLNIPHLTEQNAGIYQIFVTNIYGNITSTVVNLSVVLPLADFTAHSVGKSILFQTTGLPNTPYYLQLATNLVPPIGWTTVCTNFTDTNGNWNLVISNIPENPFAFFRMTGE